MPSLPTTYLCETDLNRFLMLIRDSYQKADLANLFLEQNSKTVNISALANLRDVLSHLATFLRAGLSPEKRSEQIVNATEHLRRAILEPYELAYRDNLHQFQPLFQRYSEELLPVREEHAFLASAPTRQNIESRLSAIHALAEKGRLAKANNDWVPEWEAGIGCYIDAFQQLAALVHQVEEHWFKFQQITQEDERKKELGKAHKRIEEVERSLKFQSESVERLSEGHKRSIRLHYIGIIVAIVLFLLTDYKFHIMHHLVGALELIRHWF